MTATPNGVLYAYLSPNYYGTTLYTVNPSNGAQSPIGALGGHFQGAFASDASGNLFITVGNGTPDQLYSVNQSTEAATPIGSVGSVSATTMAFDANALYLTDFSVAIWTVNTTTGAGTEISTYDNLTYGFIYALSSQYRTGGPPPVIESVCQVNGAVTVTWKAVAGLRYQLQYSPRLAPGDWMDLGAPMTAIGPTQSAGDLAPTNSERFYRVILLPR